MNATGEKLLVIAALLLAWEGASRAGLVSPFALPPPSRVAEALAQLATDGFPQGIDVFTHVGRTLSRIVQGFLLGSVCAIPLGLMLGRAPRTERAVRPLVTAARSVATISLLPLAIAWFGVGELSKVLLIAYGAFWAVITATIQGAAAVDPRYLDVARMCGASRSATFLRVVLPATLPRIFAGLKIAVGLCFMVIIAVEMVGTLSGLGALIQQARAFYRTDLAIAGTVVIGVTGLLLAGVLAWLERRLMPWAVGLDEVRR